MTTLAKIPLGGFFADFNGCIFRKAAKVEGRRKFRLECVTSPMAASKPLGPICAAFFCRPGDVVYREGTLEVQLVLPVVEADV